MECKLFIGQKVSLLQNPKWEGMCEETKFLPNTNDIYTIRDIRIYNGHPYILLKELINPLVDTQIGMVEQGFYYKIFTPINKRSTNTGMAILNRLLNKDMQELSNDI